MSTQQKTVTIPLRSRASWARLALILLVVAVAAAGLPRSTSAGAYPNSIAATGDSITVAFNTGRLPFTDAPRNSWSTGANQNVNSVYLRLLALNPGISGHNQNFAVSGAKMVDLLGQVGSVNAQQVEYVTILMGANDVCASSEQAMTSVEDFRAQFLDALNSLAGGSPNAQVFVLSIPDVYHLWDILKNSSAARSKWALFQICQSMLARPLSMQQADVDRRNRVRQRNIDFNTQLQEVCAMFARCRFDDNAFFNYQFATSDVSTRDYFHPSLAGQATLAQEAWEASGFAP